MVSLFLFQKFSLAQTTETSSFQTVPGREQQEPSPGSADTRVLASRTTTLVQRTAFAPGN